MPTALQTIFSHATGRIKGSKRVLTLSVAMLGLGGTSVYVFLGTLAEFFLANSLPEALFLRYVLSASAAFLVVLSFCAPFLVGVVRATLVHRVGGVASWRLVFDERRRWVHARFLLAWVAPPVILLLIASYLAQLHMDPTIFMSAGLFATIWFGLTIFAPFVHVDQTNADPSATLQAASALVIQNMPFAILSLAVWYFAHFFSLVTLGLAAPWLVPIGWLVPASTYLFLTRTLPQPKTHPASESQDT